MWEHYRKTFIPIQLLIILILVILKWHWQLPLSAIVVYALVMELFAVGGAMWGMRLRKKVAGQRANRS
jgi:hypothetical protein